MHARMLWLPEARQWHHARLSRAKAALARAATNFAVDAPRPLLPAPRRRNV